MRIKETNWLLTTAEEINAYRRGFHDAYCNRFLNWREYAMNSPEQKAWARGWTKGERQRIREQEKAI